MDPELIGLRLHGIDERPSPLGGLAWNPGLLSRNGVRYLRCRSWRQETKRADLYAMKLAKLDLDPEFIAGVVADMKLALGEMFGTGFFDCVVPVACGHSRRQNCLSVRIAVGLAESLGAACTKVFADRFMSGSSHPKEFARLPPLEMMARPQGRVLVVDDLATSGWHMHEAVGAIRAMGRPAFGAVWLAGVKQ
jgi:orotate phosphoribosyltransferase-like protein